MPVVHVYVGEGVLDGGELVFAWAVFEGGPGEVTNEVAKRAVKRGDRWCVEKGHELLCEELRGDCDVFVLPESGDGVRRELTDLGAMRPGDRVHVRSRRRARETYLRRCIPSPAGVPTSPYPKTPVASIFPSPVGGGSGEAADAASCPVWDAKAEDAVDKELSFECESPSGASTHGSSPLRAAEGAAGGYTDAWCEAWAACVSSEELVRLLTPQCQQAVRALTLGEGDSHSLALTSATGFPDGGGGGGGGTGVGGEEASQLSLGFGDGPYNQMGVWESLVVPPDGRSPAPPAPPSTSCQTTGQSPAGEYEDAEAAADAAAAAAEKNAAADVTSDDALQSPMLEHVFMQVVHGQRSLSPDASQRITAKDLQKNRTARMQIEHAHRLSSSTAWASLSPERRRGLSQGGDEQDPSSPPRLQQQPASPVTRACDRVLSAERAGDEEESSRAYARLLASLRHSKLKDLPPHKQQQLLQQHQQQQALLRSPPSSVASPDSGVRRKTRRQALCDAEPVARRNLQREESAAWVRVFKAARAARDVAASSARHKSWEAASARKRWCTRGQWRVIAGETSLRQMCILESLETWKPLASLLRTQEIEMVRRVAIFAGWEQEWRRLSVVLGDWRSTLDEETQRRAEEEEAAAAMEHPEGGVFTTEEARDGYLEELRLIEERKHVLGEQICQEEFREELQEEQDEWDNRQSAWFQDRERHRLEALYHPTAYGVLQQRRQIPYTGGDFTKARAQHYQTREPPTDRPRTLGRGPRTPRSTSKTPVQGAPPSSAATPAAATASPASQTRKTPRREDGNAGVWPFELHRRQLEDRLFGYS